jgi:phosphoadenosine phosphosulfate reductase
MTHVHPRISLSSLVSRLRETVGETQRSAVLTTSFSKEDQLILWAIVESGLDVGVVSLDTGCLFPGTLEVWRQTEAHFGIQIERLAPSPEKVRNFEAEGGMSAIYQDPSVRRACCGFRKLEPLRAALNGKSWWITGLRNAQSENRSGMTMVEEAPDWNLTKVHPLIDWPDAVVEAAIDETGVPVNPLYSMGYPSIGCAPCTRPVLPHESARAGRWWWESSSRECGLHKG